MTRDPESRLPFFGNACVHGQHSPPDDMGDAICGDCGAVVRVAFTKAGFFDLFDTVYRDFGTSGRHSKRCVCLPDQEWVCADDCRMGGR